MHKPFIITDDMVESARFTLSSICGFEITAQTERKSLESAQRVAPAPVPNARVKPLDWIPVVEGGRDIQSVTEFGTYTISIDSSFAGGTHYLWTPDQREYDDDHHSEHSGMTLARAAAQADYECRANPSPAPVLSGGGDLRTVVGALLGTIQRHRKWLKNSLARDEVIEFDNAVNAVRAVWSETAAPAPIADTVCPTCDGTGKEGRHSICRDCDETTSPVSTLGWVTVRVEDTGDGLIINPDDALKWRLRDDQAYEGRFLPDGTYRIAIPAQPPAASLRGTK